jgi:uncharacterized membrane protein YeaQ/YmgE (transglycosylase-associated protein family)
MGVIGYIISLLITGLIVGAIGRLVVPGPNPMSIWATLGIGVVGALVGSLIAGALGFGWLLTIILEIVIAALLVWFLASRTRAPGTGRPRP